MFAIVTGTLSGACMAYLSYYDNGVSPGDNYSIGLAITIMTPLYMNSYFGRAPF